METVRRRRKRRRLKRTSQTLYTHLKWKQGGG